LLTVVRIDFAAPVTSCDLSNSVLLDTDLYLNLLNLLNKANTAQKRALASTSSIKGRIILLQTSTGTLLQEQRSLSRPMPTYAFGTPRILLSSPSCSPLLSLSLSTTFDPALIPPSPPSSLPRDLLAGTGNRDPARGSTASGLGACEEPPGCYAEAERERSGGGERVLKGLFLKGGRDDWGGGVEKGRRGEGFGAPRVWMELG